MLYNIPYVILCYVIQHMLNVMLCNICYMTYVMLYHRCYVMLYNLCYGMLYNMCYVMYIRYTTYVMLYDITTYVMLYNMCYMT